MRGLRARAQRPSWRSQPKLRRWLLRVSDLRLLAAKLPMQGARQHHCLSGAEGRARRRAAGHASSSLCCNRSLFSHHLILKHKQHGTRQQTHGTQEQRRAPGAQRRRRLLSWPTSPHVSGSELRGPANLAFGPSSRRRASPPFSPRPSGMSASTSDAGDAPLCRVCWEEEDERPGEQRPALDCRHCPQPAAATADRPLAAHVQVATSRYTATARRECTTAACCNGSSPRMAGTTLCANCALGGGRAPSQVGRVAAPASQAGMEPWPTGCRSGEM